MRTLFVSRPEFSNTVSVDEYNPFGTVVYASWDYSFREKDSITNQRLAIANVLKVF